MTTAELLVRCLENEGVDYAFGVPGEETLALLDALLDSKIRFLQTRHEQGAAFMADVQGRLSGKARLCLASSRTALRAWGSRSPGRSAPSCSTPRSESWRRPAMVVS